MSAFENFVQQELPKRGYLNSDVAQESIIVRRGVGPRQFDAVTLQEGQALVLKNGQLQGITIVSSTLKKSVINFNSDLVWLVQHNLNSENIIIQCFDDTKSVIIPDSIQIQDSNLVIVTFNTAISGIARVITLD